MSDDPLNPQMQLSIRKEVEGLLVKIAALFGLVNFAVAAAAIWAMYGTVTSSADATLQREIRDVREEFDDALKDARELIGRLKTRSEDLVTVEKEIRDLERNMARVVQDTSVPQVADLLDKVQNTPDMMENLAKVPALASQRKVEETFVSAVPGCNEPVYLNGRSDLVATPWQRYGDRRNGIFTEVSLPDGHFREAPQIFTSLGGNSGHWLSVGPTSIYTPEDNKFTVYLRWVDGDTKQDLLPYAVTHNWHINWLAVGC